MTARFDYTGLIARFFLCGFVVFAVYNPGQVSWYHWVMTWSLDNWDIKLLSGVALAAGWFILGRATYQTIGLLGIGTVAVLNVLTALALNKAGLFGDADFTVIMIIVLLSITAAFTIGVSYGHIYHRVTGVVHTEQVH